MAKCKICGGHQRDPWHSPVWRHIGQYHAYEPENITVEEGSRE